MYKFRPILKSLIWGGEKIAPYKGIETDMKAIGESWEISGVKGNESVVAGGVDDGMTIPELIARDKEQLLGKANFDRSSSSSMHVRTSQSRYTPTMPWHGNVTSQRARPRCGML